MNISQHIRQTVDVIQTMDVYRHIQRPVNHSDEWCWISIITDLLVIYHCSYVLLLFNINVIVKVRYPVFHWKGGRLKRAISNPLRVKDGSSRLSLKLYCNRHYFCISRTEDVINLPLIPQAHLASNITTVLVIKQQMSYLE